MFIFYIIFLVLLVFLVLFDRFKFKQKLKKEKVIEFIILFFCLNAFCAFIFVNLSSGQDELVKYLDEEEVKLKQYGELEYVVNKNIMDEVKVYNSMVRDYKTYTLASSGKDSKCFWMFAGPFNPIVFKDFEREYTTFEIVDVQFRVVEKE